jgi:hypothetical protein
MVDPVELHIWGEGLGLPSLDAECIAVVAYLIHTSEKKPNLNWTIIPNYDTSISPNGTHLLLYEYILVLMIAAGDFPCLTSARGKGAGFRSSIKELEALGYCLGMNANEDQQSELLAYVIIRNECNIPILMNIVGHHSSYSAGRNYLIYTYLHHTTTTGIK